MRQNKKSLLSYIINFCLTSACICILSGPLPRMLAASPDKMLLIDIKTRNVSEAGFDLELTVNNIAVSNGASVVYAYTTDANLKVTPENIASLPHSASLQLIQMKTVTSRAYQTVFSVSVSAAPAQPYYIYAMLKGHSGSTDISSHVLNYGKEYICYTYVVPTPTPTPIPATTPMPTPGTTETPSPGPIATEKPSPSPKPYRPPEQIRLSSYDVGA